jgi:polyphosphate kinase
VTDPSLKQRVKHEILAAYLADNVKARFLDRNGRYLRLPRRKDQPPFAAQDFLIAVAEGAATAADIPEMAKPPFRPGAQRKSAQRRKELVS